MKVVYIAGPYRAKDAWQREQNIRRAEEAAFLVAEAGMVPLCPHTMTRYFDGTITDDYWLAATMALLERCDAVLLLPGWEQSVGSRAEVRRARESRIALFLALDELKAWFDEGAGGERVPDTH